MYAAVPTLLADASCPVTSALLAELARRETDAFPLVRLVLFPQYARDPRADIENRAVWCADALGGRRSGFLDASQHGPDGSLAWFGARAATAGIADTLAFFECMRSPGADAALAQGLSLTDRLGTATSPTLWIRDSLFVGASEIRARLAVGPER